MLAVGLLLVFDISSNFTEAFGVPPPELVLKVSVEDRVRLFSRGIADADSVVGERIVVRKETSSEKGIRGSRAGRTS